MSVTLVPLTQRTILAVGGGFRCSSALAPLGFLPVLYQRAHVRQVSVLHIGTASGDDPEQEAEAKTFFEQFGHRLKSFTSLNLCALDAGTEAAGLAEQIFAANVIYVSSGNTPKALDIWRKYGVDTLLIEAWARGIVCVGSSAGALCWFEQLVTDAFGDPQLIDGLGLIKGAAVAHVDTFDEGHSYLMDCLRQGKVRSNVVYGIANSSALMFSGETYPMGINVGPNNSWMFGDNDNGETVSIIDPSPESAVLLDPRLLDVNT